MTRKEHQRQVREAGKHCKIDRKSLYFALINYIRDKQALRHTRRALNN